MEAIKNFLNLINDNWTLIITIIGLALLLYKKIKNYLKLSDDEKITLALNQVRVIILKLVTDAEAEYKSGTGEIKRADVINKIFEKYPILSKVTNSYEIVSKIDEYIDEALKSLNNILSSNEKFKNEVLGDEINVKQN